MKRKTHNVKKSDAAIAERKPRERLRWYEIAAGIFITAVTCIFYINLGRDALFDWDEGIYAQLGAELLASGNLFVTTWNAAPWFEKPPGIAWISAAGQALGGHTAFGARLFQPVFAASVLVMVYLIGKKLKSWRTGVMSIAILAGFNLFLGRTRAVNTDMPLLLGLTGTVAALLYGARPAAVAAVIAMSVWFKGIAGLLPVLITLPLFMSKGKRYTLSVGLWSLLFILPWHLFVYASYGDIFLTPYLREQVIARAQNPIEFHLESRWFYFRYLYENLGLGVLTVAGLGMGLSLYKKKPLLAWWVLVPLSIFTVAKTRLFWYILPVYPALSLACAYAVDGVSMNKKARTAVVILAIGMCLQSLSAAWKSVEPEKKTAQIPPRIELAEKAKDHTVGELMVLVPESERIAEAILPATQRISSSFRYGGNPSLVYYFGRVRYYYNLDEFRNDWEQSGDPYAIISRKDIDTVGIEPAVVEGSGSEVIIRKAENAER